MSIHEGRGMTRETGAEAGARGLSRLAIVIVSYNTRKLLRRCLESLAAFPPRAGFDVVIVDNASRDGSVDMVRREFPWVRLVTNKHNLGYSAAVNQGFDVTDGEYVLVLNPDIVVRESSLDRLLEFMDSHPDAGLAGAKLLNTDGSLQYSCRSFYTPRTLLMRRTPLGRFFPRSTVLSKHLMLEYDHAEPRAVDWVIGACMMVRRAAAEAVGGMDERFFLYFEDVDWCFRMSRQGWKVYYIPEAEMVHEHRRDSARPRLSRSFWAHLGSMLRFYEKWNRYAYGIKRYREVLKIVVFVATDLVAVNLAFLGAYGLRVALASQFVNPLYTLEHYHNFWVFTNMIALLALFFSGQYQIGRGKRASDELFELVRAMAVALVVIMASTYIARERLISRAVVLLFFFLCPLSLWLFRRALRALHVRVLEMRLDLRRLAIVGHEDESRELRSLVSSRPELGLDVVGYIDPQERSRRALGTLDDLPKVVREHRIQQVLVAPSVAEVERVTRIVLQLRRRAVDVQVVSGYADLLSHKARVERLADLPVLAFGRDTLYPVHAATKRALDLAGAGVLLVLGLLPAMLYWVVAKLRGRPLYRFERRLGQDACPFDLPLVQDDLPFPPADFVNLPALWAVLRGRLSLVGPYPLAPELESGLSEWQRLRFDVRPGLAGFWRTVRPEAIDLERVVRLDLYYIQNWSSSLDLRLLLQCLGEMLRGRGLRLDLGPMP